MSWWKKLFGDRDETQSSSGSRTQPTGNPVTDYKNALAYLDRCGSFNEQKLREVNRIAGSMLSESDIQMMLGQAQMIMPSANEPGGMDYIKSSIREQLVTFINMTGRLGL